MEVAIDFGHGVSFVPTGEKIHASFVVSSPHGTANVHGLSARHVAVKFGKLLEFPFVSGGALQRHPQLVSLAVVGPTHNALERTAMFHERTVPLRIVFSTYYPMV